MLIGLFMAGWQAGAACADVVIKVRALNPLDTKEKAVINYPLPKEVSERRQPNLPVHRHLEYSLVELDKCIHIISPEYL